MEFFASLTQLTEEQVRVARKMRFVGAKVAQLDRRLVRLERMVKN